MLEVNCAVCGSGKHSVLLVTPDVRYKVTAKKFTLVQCTNCGLIYLNPMPTENEIGNYYPKKLYYTESLPSRLYSEIICHRKYATITNHVRDGKVLDVGCGTGGLLSLFKSENWHAYGVEVSKDGYLVAKQKLGTHVFNCELRDCRFPSNFFDVVILNHVLEHMLHPVEELEEISRILKNNGILYLSVPNINSLQFRCTKKFWFHLDVPRHVYHYLPSTLVSLLKQTGFTLTSKIMFSAIDFPLDFFQSLRAKWFNNRYKLFMPLVLVPLSLVSSFIQLFPAWRGTMVAILKKT